MCFLPFKSQACYSGQEDIKQKYFLPLPLLLLFCCYSYYYYHHYHHNSVTTISFITMICSFLLNVTELISIRALRALLYQTSTFNVMPFGICVIQKVVILQDASRCCLAVYSNLRGDPNYPCVGFSM